MLISLPATRFSHRDGYLKTVLLKGETDKTRRAITQRRYPGGEQITSVVMLVKFL